MDKTYRITYGVKESWWFGSGLSGVPFAFENHYSSIVGWLKARDGVCGFNDKLLRYNGSLVKNKAADATTFEVPTHWMMDATWEKSGSKPEISCIVGGQARLLTPE